MRKIRRAYEKVILYIIGKLAETVVRSAKLNFKHPVKLEPFMHIIRGDNGVRFIGIYCDLIWKVMNEERRRNEDANLITIKLPERVTDTRTRKPKKSHKRIKK